MIFKKGHHLQIEPKIIEYYFNILNKFTILDNAHLIELVNIHQIEDRYSDILPYKHNCVKLSNKRYINASFIHIPTKNNIIATQGPIKETINDFWDMIFEYDCKIIVQLCNLNENGKEKCFDYININKLNYQYDITYINLRWRDYNFQIQELNVRNKIKNKIKNVYHIWFNNWDDHGIPEIRFCISTFLLIFKIIDKKKNNKPFVVHCSAGVGRTGCFIAMYLLYSELKDKLNEQIIEFNIFNVVRQLREMRLHCIQNATQFYFIYLFVKYFLEHNTVNKFDIDFL
jgi:protein-tyrosine phosphatase